MDVLSKFTVVEYLSFITGIIFCWYYAQEKLAGLFWAIPNAVLFIYMNIEQKLYGELILSIYFLVMNTVGIYVWLFGGKNKTELTITYSKGSELAVQYSLGILFSFVCGYLFANYTDASLPYVDAFPLCFSLIGQWQFTFKKMQNWYTWIGVDIITTGIYFYKGYYLIAILYIIYTILAIYGLYKWIKNYDKYSTSV